MLFYRVLELAVVHAPVRYKDLVATQRPRAVPPKASHVYEGTRPVWRCLPRTARGGGKPTPVKWRAAVAHIVRSGGPLTPTMTGPPFVLRLHAPEHRQRRRRRPARHGAIRRHRTGALMVARPVRSARPSVCTAGWRWRTWRPHWSGRGFQRSSMPTSRSGFRSRPFIVAGARASAWPRSPTMARRPRRQIRVPGRGRTAQGSPPAVLVSSTKRRACTGRAIDTAVDDRTTTVASSRSARFRPRGTYITRMEQRRPLRQRIDVVGQPCGNRASSPAGLRPVAAPLLVRCGLRLDRWSTRDPTRPLPA